MDSNSMIQNLSAAVFDRNALNFRRDVKNDFVSESMDIFLFILTIDVIELFTRLVCPFPRLATRIIAAFCIACSLFFRPSRNLVFH